MSHRRDDALHPYYEKDAWRHFKSFDHLDSEYDGGWVTGSVDSLNDSIDFSIRTKRGSRRLAVVFNSQQKANSPLKLFTWGNVGKLLDCTRLHISDPTLNVSELATLGWYTANAKGNFQRQIESLILLFKKKLQIDEILFLGSSGGGFPAVYFSQVFPNSMAFLLAPVFNVKQSVQERAKLQFAAELNAVDTFEEAVSIHPDVTFDVGETLLANSNKLINPVHILQSRKDTRFWEHQTRPFLEKTGSGFKTPPKVLVQDNLSMVLGDWADGHAPPPIEVINTACEGIARQPLGSLSNYNLLASLGSRFID